MASLIPGFEYDIFISYRQKDNKGDKWVSEFVDALKDELESTFKEEISVYFDINPYDGLLETHDVNASLKEKLKCLVFIPIISQTYCDSKSFAWQHEFIAFNNLAKEDQFGRDIRLAGGNVASRILPVKIHDLDPEDKTLLENELGGVLRSMEFIYKSAGVNRPLTASDNPDKNLNKTFYRDQINKVANAVKEIITAIKKHTQQNGEVPKEVVKAKPEKSKNRKTKIIIASFTILALLALVYFFISKQSESSEPVEKSIAVLPFENMSDSEEHSWFGDAMTDEIIMQLYKIKEFIIRSRPSVMQYKGTSKTSPVIGKELNVNYLIGGSAQRSGDQVKIRVQLINAVTDTPMWVETFEGNWKDILSIQSDIAKQIADKLKTVLSTEEIMQIDKKPTENPDAYKYYLLGNDYYKRSYNNQDRIIALKMYEKAIELDHDFSMAYVGLALCHLRLYWALFDHSLDRLTESKKAIDEAFRIDPNLPQAHLALGFYYYWGFLNYSRALEEVKIAENTLKNNSECVLLKASIYRRAGQWSLAKENFLKAFELDPGSPLIISDLALTLFFLSEYEESEKYYNKALLLNPTFIEVIWQKSFMYMSWKGNTTQARATIAEAFQFKECTSDPLLFEVNVLTDIFDGNYQNALSDLSSKDIDIIDHHLYYYPKSLLYARVYNLMNMPGKAYSYLDSARIMLESRILKNADDSRLYSAVGIAYAGLGLKEKAVEAGKRAVDMMPINKEALRGIYRAEDLARIYVMVGEYDAAIDQIKLLLKIPSRLSVKLLQLDPVWKPLWNLPEFKKIINTFSPDASRIK